MCKVQMPFLLLFSVANFNICQTLESHYKLLKKEETLKCLCSASVKVNFDHLKSLTSLLLEKEML